jgi:hypothetical protein
MVKVVSNKKNSTVIGAATFAGEDIIPPTGDFGLFYDC